MASPAVHSKGPQLLWLAVGYLITDCIASIKLASAFDLPEGAAQQAGSGSSGPGSSSGGRSSGSSSGGSGTRAILVDKASLRFFKFERGELVVLKSPEEPRRRLVRRLVGLEGDWVSVAGAKVERVPKGLAWVEADSGLKAPGGDSRLSWGAVPLALVEGRVSRVLWPPALWGALSPQPCPSGTKVVGKADRLEFLHPPADEDNWWA